MTCFAQEWLKYHVQERLSFRCQSSKRLHDLRGQRARRPRVQCHAVAGKGKTLKQCIEGKPLKRDIKPANIFVTQQRCPISDFTTPSLQFMRNPNVSVRSRGVMEKCSYCVQRIQAAKIHAEEENRQVRDGEIVTACQAAGPAEAILFGDINDPNSRVAKLKREPSNYGLLADLNTRPRTTYLGKLRNPNPELEEGNHR